MFIWQLSPGTLFYAPTGGPFIYAPGNTRPVPYLLPSQQFSLSISNANNSFPPTRMMQLCNNYQDLFWIHCWEMLYWRDLLIIWGERRVYIYTYIPHCERTQKIHTPDAKGGTGVTFMWLWGYLFSCPNNNATSFTSFWIFSIIHDVIRCSNILILYELFIYFVFCASR